jgi:hypothetical protein
MSDQKLIKVILVLMNWVSDQNLMIAEQMILLSKPVMKAIFSTFRDWKL